MRSVGAAMMMAAGLSATVLAQTRQGLAPAAWVADVAASLGPFRLLNDDSELNRPSC
jgi:hypothetical protein